MFTLVALFAVGASRALIANVTWWLGGFEMLALGSVVAAAAYYSGAAVAALGRQRQNSAHRGEFSRRSPSHEHSLQ